MKIIAYAALTLALFGCEAEAPAPMSVPASGGASVMVLRPVETREEALSAGPGAVVDLANLLVDDRLCYYARVDGAIAPLTDTTGAQICEQAMVTPGPIRNVVYGPAPSAPSGFRAVDTGQESIPEEVLAMWPDEPQWTILKRDGCYYYRHAGTNISTVVIGSGETTVMATGGVGDMAFDDIFASFDDNQEGVLWDDPNAQPLCDGGN